MVGLRPKHISDTEKVRKVRIHTLMRMAVGLGVTIGELVEIS